MYRDYALDPEAVVVPEAVFVLNGAFSWSQGRTIAEYPRKWPSMVLAAAKASMPPVARKRVEDWAFRVSRQRLLIARQGGYDEARTWLENAQDEHSRRPFKRIVSRTRHPEPADFLSIDDLIDGKAKWPDSNGHIPRRAQDFAEALANLLVRSAEVMFVDPYFDPRRERCRNPIEAMIRTFCCGRASSVTTRIDLHTSIKRRLDRNDEPTSDELILWAAELRKDCERFMSACVPRAFRLTVHLWKEHPRGQQFHNRFVLTNLGGVKFGHGLDEGEPERDEYDDLSRLPDDHLEACRQMFAPGAQTFERVGKPFIIDGAG